MSKRGAEKILSVYWFAILFIVAAAVVYMVSSFYGGPYDVREIETDLLADKIARCLNSGGYINENWQSFDDNTLLSECELSFNVEDTNGWKNDQYYAEVEVMGFNTEQTLKKISAGNQNLKLGCDIESPNFPVCLEREMYSIDDENNRYKIKILSVIRKTEKNAQ